MSDMYEMVFARECPSCRVAISKLGGCPHMTCRRCKYEFCWHCMHPHHGHSFLLCLTSVAIKILLPVIIILQILFFTDSFYPLCNFFAEIIGYIAVNLIFFNIAPLAVYFIYQIMWVDRMDCYRGGQFFRLGIAIFLLGVVFYEVIVEGFARDFVKQMIFEGTIWVFYTFSKSLPNKGLTL
jgi:hypothetical protein